MTERQFFPTHSLFRYALTSPARQDCAEWAQVVMADGDQWVLENPNKPFASLQDFTVATTLTPAMHHHVVEVNRYFAKLSVPATFVAVILQKNLGFQLGKIFVERELNRIDRSLHLKVFFIEAEALEWLKTQLESHPV